MIKGHANGGEMGTIRFHRYGDPADVLHLEQATIPNPGPRHV